MSMARSTPAQNDRGLASSTCRGPTAAAHSASDRCGRPQRPQRRQAAGHDARAGPAAAPAVSEIALSTTAAAAGGARQQRRGLHVDRDARRWRQARACSPSRTQVVRPSRSVRWAASPARRSSPASSGADGQRDASLLPARDLAMRDHDIADGRSIGQAAGHAADGQHVAAPMQRSGAAAAAARIGPYARS